MTKEVDNYLFSIKLKSSKPGAFFQDFNLFQAKNITERKKNKAHVNHSSEEEKTPGFITHTWSNGDKYEGQMFQNQMHGRGIFTSSQGYVYTGEFKFGKPSGIGKLVYDNGDKYEGNFVNDMLHGKGKYIYANGDRYQGEFQNDLPHGQGVYILANGNTYSGLWEKGGLVS